MFYTGIKAIEPREVRERTVAGLQRLRAALAEQVPRKTATSTLLLATWNIREFDSGKYGWRSRETYYYIAEILSRFDLIAIQEVKDGLYPLQELTKILGSWWDYIVTDVTLGQSGNTERMAFLFDKRKVAFTGLAAELVLEKKKGQPEEPRQFARSPYIAGFRAGWAYFTLLTVHIYYGEGVAVDPRRLKEIEDFAGTVAKNAGNFNCAPQREPGVAPKRNNLIMLGDFNIFKPTDDTMKAIAKAGFLVPEELTKLPGSNVARNKYYDQIAYYKELHGMKPLKAGIFDFYEHVYRLDADPAKSDEATYHGIWSQTNSKTFKDWRTYQMSDHLPMWIELSVDDSEGYLKWLASAGERPKDDE